MLLTGRGVTCRKGLWLSTPAKEAKSLTKDVIQVTEAWPQRGYAITQPVPKCRGMHRPNRRDRKEF